MKTTHEIIEVKRTKRGRVTMVTVRLFAGTPSETIWRVRELLTRQDANPKLAKRADDQWLSVVMHLAPHKLAAIGNLCPWATDCVEPCLNTSGRGRMTNTQLARIARTVVFMLARDVFGEMLTYELERFARTASADGLGSAARLNGTSDVRFYRFFPWLFDSAFPIDVYYDYTKDPLRALHALDLNRNIERYHITFSFDGANWEVCETALRLGTNVAVVFRDKATVQRAIKSGFRGYIVHNGDDTDQRFLDPSPRVIALYAKGKAKTDTSGFVVDI